MVLSDVREDFSVRTYLNEEQITQLFVASGDDHLSDPSLFPWTIAWQPAIREEGGSTPTIYRRFTRKKIVALWQNDYFSRELFRGLEDGLGDVAKLIRVDIAYEIADEHLDTHVSILKQSVAEIFLFAGLPADAAKVTRSAANLNWHPVFILSYMASSIAALKPAGLENAIGVVTATFWKDPDDPAWKQQLESKDWQEFVDKYNRVGGTDDNAAAFGYAAAEAWFKFLNGAVTTCLARTSCSKR